MSEEVQVLLSKVSGNISEAQVKMSYVSQQNRSKCLAAIGKILHQLRCLVSTKLSTNDAPTSIYSIYYNEDDDTNFKASTSNDSITSSEDEEEVLDAQTCLEECVTDAQTCSEESVNDSSMSDSVSSTTAAPSEVMMTKVLAAISNLAPFSIYDRKKAMRKRRKRRRKMICRELFSIWSHAATIVTPANNAVQSVTNSYPTVDWKSVNKRFLTNIPSPVPLPVLGCSQDPADYEDVYQKNDYGGMQNLGSKFTREFPFGSALGYLTDAGAVRVPDDVFHGYVFEVGQGWILHADFPRKLELQNRRKKEVVRRKRRKNCGT